MILLNRSYGRFGFSMRASVYKEKTLKGALEIRPLVAGFSRLFFQAAQKVHFRIKIIEEAVAQVVQSPEFLEDNAKVNFNITYLNTEDTQARVKEVRAKMLDIGQKLGF